MATTKAPGYALYWRIWGILLAVTLVMILIDRPAAQALSEGDASRGALIVILLLAMLLKAVLIAGYFMHLRYERAILALCVLLGLLINGAILYLLILPDGFAILEMLTG